MIAGCVTTFDSFSTTVILKESLNFEKFGIRIFPEIQNKSGVYNTSFNKLNVLSVWWCLCGDLRETLKDLKIYLLLEGSCFWYLRKVRKKNVWLFGNAFYKAKFTDNQAAFSMGAGSEPKLCVSSMGLFLEISTALSREQPQCVFVSLTVVL